MSDNPIVYTSESGVASTYEDLMVEPHCFVCRRHTDHFAEHDALVAAGLALYREDGSVLRTDKWDDELASSIQEAEYQALYGHLNLG